MTLIILFKILVSRSGIAGIYRSIYSLSLVPRLTLVQGKPGVGLDAACALILNVSTAQLHNYGSCASLFSQPVYTTSVARIAVSFTSKQGVSMVKQQALKGKLAIHWVPSCNAVASVQSLHSHQLAHVPAALSVPDTRNMAAQLGLAAWTVPFNSCRSDAGPVTSKHHTVTC